MIVNINVNWHTYVNAGFDFGISKMDVVTMETMQNRSKCIKTQNRQLVSKKWKATPNETLMECSLP